MLKKEDFGDTYSMLEYAFQNEIPIRKINSHSIGYIKKVTNNPHGEYGGYVSFYNTIKENEDEIPYAKEISHTSYDLDYESYDTKIKTSIDVTELINSVELWAYDRGILGNEYNPNLKLNKVLEELGELSAALIRNDREKMIDGLGDTLVTLIVLAAELKINIPIALQQVYNIISKRTGKLVNGTFVKDEENEILP